MSIFRIIALTILSTLSAVLSGQSARATIPDVTEPFSCTAVSEIPLAECEALIALYNNTDGSNWDDSTGWLTTDTPCSWYGVTCGAGLVSDGTEHVTELELFGKANNNFGLTGTLPAEIGGLTSLTRLIVNHNNLGNLPAEIGRLTNLVELRYYDNPEMTDLPAEIGDLTSLIYLSLGTHDLGTLPAEIGNLKQAITESAVDKVGEGQPLTFYLIDHGDIDTFFVDRVNDQILDPDDLNDWLAQLEAQVPDLKINVIIEACNSGSFIKRAKSISKPGRLVITSTNEKNVAYASRDGAQFSDRFLTLLREGYNLTHSFWEAESVVRELYFFQEPWIDANGDGIPDRYTDQNEVEPHEPGTDRLDADTWAPYVVWAKGPMRQEEIVNNKGLIQAEVRDNKSVERVWAAVYPPSYVTAENSRELVPEEWKSLSSPSIVLKSPHPRAMPSKARAFPSLVIVQSPLSS